MDPTDQLVVFEHGVVVLTPHRSLSTLHFPGVNPAVTRFSDRLPARAAIAIQSRSSPLCSFENAAPPLEIIQCVAGMTSAVNRGSAIPGR